ncbi:hypothetical protein KFK09_008102 [Dendrobium nobile]|uniref:Integrase catalytic domain-containing protein n=1 Tax=Dendrobium nobile TaxID=94219 RepID=A0A8T3BZ02_DENNO|nr:hypothetical protein KFK09_008102 [Dendrobium nobile]
MVHKSETVSKFLLFKAMVEKQFSKSIKIFCSDGGGEYASTPFQNFMFKADIIHQFSCPYSPQQNGLADLNTSILSKPPTLSCFKLIFPFHFG